MAEEGADPAPPTEAPAPATPAASAGVADPSLPAGSFGALPRWIRWTCIALVAAGAVGLLRNWVFARSLWMDELTVCNHIVESGPGTILALHSKDQGAPLGFLLLQKSVTLVFGASEMALRLLPLLAVLGTLALVPVAAARWLPPLSVPVATALVALSEGMRYYGNEAKPYGMDAFVALGLLLLGDRWLRGETDRRRLAVPALAGAAAIWISFPSIFALAALGLGGLALAIAGRDRRRAVAILLPGLLWLGLFAFSYVLTLGEMRENNYLRNFWAQSLAPFPPVTTEDWSWYPEALRNAMEVPLGVGIPWLAAALCAAGAVRTTLRDRRTAILLLGPLAMALAASCMGAYPLRQRLIVFAVPALALLVADGATWLRLPGPPAGTCIARGILAGLLLVSPLVQAGREFARPKTREEIRPVLETLAAKAKAGDLVYVYDGAVPGYLFYSRSLDLGRLDYRFGVRDLGQGISRSRDLAALPGERPLWVVFSHIRNPDRDRTDDRDAIMSLLRRRRPLLDRWLEDGASLHLLGPVR